MSKKNTFRKYAVTTMAAATAAAVVPAAVSADSKQFTDVKPGDSHYDAIMALTEEGIFQGYTDGSFGIGDSITRAQVAVTLYNYLGLTEVENLETALASFEDVDVDHEYAKQIAGVAEAGIFKGDASKFHPWENITREQMATVIVQALDLDQYDTGKDVAVNLNNVSKSHKDNVQIFANLGITNQLNDYRPAEEVTRGQFASFLKLSIDAIEETEQTVESIKAINASELKVTFSTEVDEESAEKAANYDLKINDKAVAESAFIDIELAKDKKSAIILLDQDAESFKNGDRYVIQTNDKIKTEKGEALEKFVSEEQTFAESAAPALLGTSYAEDELVFTFDRPVDATGSDNVQLIKVDGIEIGSQDLKPVFSKDNSEVLNKAGVYEYSVAITEDAAKDVAKKIGTHEVVIFDAYDTAQEYPSRASVLRGSYTITDEVQAPEVVGVEAVNANRFFVETNVSVNIEAAKVTVNKAGHEFPNGGDYENDTAPQSDLEAESAAYAGSHDGKPGIWVIVTDTKASEDENPLYRQGENSANLSVTVENYKSNGGLLGKKTTKDITLNKNNTKPVVDSTVLKTDGTLAVTFTDAIEANTELKAGKDFVVRDNDGIIIEGFSNVTTDGSKTIEFTSDKVDKKDAPYTIEFKADKFKNAENKATISGYLANTLKNDAFSVTVGEEVESSFKYTEFKFKKDKSTGNVEEAGDYKVESADNTITFKYPEKMGDSARNVANYTLDGEALPKGTTVDFVGDRETVRIVLPEGTFNTTTQYKLGVTTDVKTESGSMIVGSLQTKAPAELVFKVTDNVKPELESAVYIGDTYEDEVTNATETDKIEVTFDEAIDLNGDATHNFYVGIEGNKVKVTNVEKVTDGQNADRKLILTLETEVNVKQAATISIIPEDELDEDEEIEIVDKAGNKALEESTVETSGYKYRTP